MKKHSDSTRLSIIEEAGLRDFQDAKEAGALGFMARLLIQCTMPHSRPDSDRFVRENGGFTLQMIAVERELGLPYGSTPRLVLAWATTEAVRTKERVLELGPNLTECLRTVGILKPGQELKWGKRGTAGRADTQIRALFSAIVSWQYVGERRVQLRNVPIADSLNLAWGPKRPDDDTLWKSTVELGERFFQEIIDRPVPVDFRALSALKRSPARVDLYSNMTYRMTYLSKPTTIPWEALQALYGPEYATDRKGRYHFRVDFERHLAAVQGVYPELRAKLNEAGMIVQPSPTHVPKLEGGDR